MISQKINSSNNPTPRAPDPFAVGLNVYNSDNSSIFTLEMGQHSVIGNITSSTLNLQAVIYDTSLNKLDTLVSFGTTKEGPWEVVSGWAQDSSFTYKTTYTLSTTLKNSLNLYLKVNEYNGIRISDPIINTLASKTLQISTSTPEANIYYTTDNSTPTSSSNLYTNTFQANIGTTIKAIGIKEGYLDSDIAEFTVS